MLVPVSRNSPAKHLGRRQNKQLSAPISVVKSSHWAAIDFEDVKDESSGPTKDENCQVGKTDPTLMFATRRRSRGVLFRVSVLGGEQAINIGSHGPFSTTSAWPQHHSVSLSYKVRQGRIIS